MKSVTVLIVIQEFMILYVNCGWKAWVVQTVKPCDKNNCQQEIIHQRKCLKYDNVRPCVGKSQYVSYKDCCEKDPCNRALWKEWGKDYNGICLPFCKRYIYNRRECSSENRYCYGQFFKFRFERCAEDSCKIVHGGWSRWEIDNSEHCSITCGFGFTNIYLRRECNNPTQQGQGLDCQGPKEKRFRRMCTVKTKCEKALASVDGEWSPWIQKTFLQCPVTCGIGYQVISSIRECDNPQPMYGGKNCTGQNAKTEKQKCFVLKECIVNGGWNDWFVHSITKCKLNCQQEVIHQRLCTKPAPSPSGSYCPGPDQSITYRDCCVRHHKFNGPRWTSWTTVNDLCESSCERHVYQVRECVGKNRYCFGVFYKFRLERCRGDSCKSVQGGWSAWEVKSKTPCSVTCGYGYSATYAERECNNPKPFSQGLTCQGPNSKSIKRACKPAECKNGFGSLDGEWSPWIQTVVPPCNVTCGIGYHIVHYIRLCNNPPRLNKGKNCVGASSKIENEKCFQVKECTVNGGWNNWFIHTITKCNSNCHQEVTYRRLCTNPAPSVTGSACTGAFESYSDRDCCEKHPKNGAQWSSWKNMSGPCNRDCERYVYNINNCDGENVFCYGMFSYPFITKCKRGACKSVHGFWSRWEIKSQKPCSVTCGYGYTAIYTQRECNNPKPQGLGLKCQGPAEKVLNRLCRRPQCKNGFGALDGGWTSWRQRALKPCDATCGIGSYILPFFRLCMNPRPSRNGKKCVGPNQKTEIRKCFRTAECIVNGGWSVWFTRGISKCNSTSCGQIIIMMRLCANPAPSQHGAPCPGKSRRLATRTCCEKVDGGWGTWSYDIKGPCSATCGTSAVEVLQIRECNRPTPQFGGKNCTGHRSKIRMEPCKIVDGGWASWEKALNSCTATCGNGTKLTLFERQCTNPEPLNGGLLCPGEPVIIKNTGICWERNCPVNGRWTSWEKGGSSCSATCGNGTLQTVFKRSCTNPEPQYGGKHCVGEFTVNRNTITCLEKYCPVNGGWASWEEGETSCSVTCGNGTLVTVFKRKCSNPEPKFGGAECAGESTTNKNTSTCRGKHCPVNGGWTSWELIQSSCSATCGNGYQRMVYKRECTKPEPQNGGTVCSGESVISKNTSSCWERNCPVNGGWTSWEKGESSCSVTCGNGTFQTVFKRKCTNPEPQHGGSVCSGKSHTSRNTSTCWEMNCPVDGGWTSWDQGQEVCTVTCGNGILQIVSKRKCTNPEPQYGGKVCAGESTRSKNTTTCRDKSCPINGGWTSWEKGRVVCSVTCGSGIQRSVLKRKCTNPEPQYGGKYCAGKLTRSGDTSICLKGHCPVDGGWSAWSVSGSACSVSCGTGTLQIHFTRMCTNPKPQYGGIDCAGESTKMRDINECWEQQCPEQDIEQVAHGDTGESSAILQGTTIADGGWSSWQITLIPCKSTCGAPGTVKSVRVKIRICERPSPKSGGQYCEGPNLDTDLVDCIVPLCSVINKVAEENTPETYPIVQGNTGEMSGENFTAISTKEENGEKSEATIPAYLFKVFGAVITAMAITLIALYAFKKRSMKKKKGELSMKYPLYRNKEKREYMAYDNPVSERN